MTDVLAVTLARVVVPLGLNEHDSESTWILC